MITETISHYRVLSQIGGTGPGAVYAAEDIDSGRRVAIKFLPPDKNVDWATLEREIRTITALKHPNICTIYEAVQSEGQNFVAMELLEGETLKRKLTGQPLDTETVLAVGQQIADALDAAHGRGILHRDIRPSTIFVTAQNQVKVLDFGADAAAM